MYDYRIDNGRKITRNNWVSRIIIFSLTMFLSIIGLVYLSFRDNPNPLEIVIVISLVIINSILSFRFTFSDVELFLQEETNQIVILLKNGSLSYKISEIKHFSVISMGIYKSLFFKYYCLRIDSSSFIIRYYLDHIDSSMFIDLIADQSQIEKELRSKIFNPKSIA
jgi:hypothetical protein